MSKISYNIRQIDIAQKTQIENIRRKYNHYLSSHTFVSLYLWQKAMGLSILLEKDFFAVRCNMNGDNSWFFPCGAEKQKYDFICDAIKDKSFSLCYLSESDARWLESKFPQRWLLRRAEECDEYICDISEYVSLEGSKFSEIRRKIRKLDRTYKVTAAPISELNIDDALSVVNKWNNIVHNTGMCGLTDEHVASLALEKRELLDITGIVMYADYIPVSVFAGFPLNDDTIDILIGKCSPDAPKGMAYYALRECLKLYGGEYTYCNHEEDLGISGIRQMKNSLCPVSKNFIWEAVLK